MEAKKNTKLEEKIVVTLTVDEIVEIVKKQLLNSLDGFAFSKIEADGCIPISDDIKLVFVSECGSVESVECQ